MDRLTLADAKNQYPKVNDLVHVTDLRREFICINQVGLTPDDQFILATGGGTPLFWIAFDQTDSITNLIITGHMIDGTPIYAKWLTGTITGGNTNVLLPHNISNAYTNKRIKSIIPWIDNGSTLMKTTSSNSANIPSRSSYDNVNIILYRGVPAGTYTVYAYVEYI
jgi:hypothetical protein